MKKYYIEVEGNISGDWEDAFPFDEDAEYLTYEDAEYQKKCMEEVDYWHDVENHYRIVEMEKE